MRRISPPRTSSATTMSSTTSMSTTTTTSTNPRLSLDDSSCFSNSIECRRSSEDDIQMKQQQQQQQQQQKQKKIRPCDVCEGLPRLKRMKCRVQNHKATITVSM